MSLSVNASSATQNRETESKQHGTHSQPFALASPLCPRIMGSPRGLNEPTPAQPLDRSMKNSRTSSEKRAVVRRRVNGRDLRLKRPDAAANARPHKVSIIGHGSFSRALVRDALDLRTRV